MEKERPGSTEDSKKQETPPPFNPDRRLITEFERAKKIFPRDPGAEARRLAKKREAKKR